MLLQMVETELHKRKQEGTYKRDFAGKTHFFGYQNICSSGSLDHLIHIAVRFVQRIRYLIFTLQLRGQMWSSYKL